MLQNPENTTSINLILTNNQRSFQNSCVIETGLSDFCRIVVTVMKTCFVKARVINHGDYKSFKNKLFPEELLFQLSNFTSEENVDGLEEFIEICLKILNHHAPYVCMGQSFAMHRARFCNKHLRNKTDGNKRKHTKQRNCCLLILRKSRREYYSSLDVKNITDNKTFWKTKPFLSDKVASTQKITLIDKDKIVKNGDDTARVLNTFFSNIVSDLKITDYNNCYPLAETCFKSDSKIQKSPEHSHYRKNRQKELPIFF